MIPGNIVVHAVIEGRRLVDKGFKITSSVRDSTLRLIPNIYFVKIVFSHPHCVRIELFFGRPGARNFHISHTLL